MPTPSKSVPNGFRKTTADPELVSFDIGNRLAANALVVDLMRHGRRFEVIPNREENPTFYTFRVSLAVLGRVQQHQQPADQRRYWPRLQRRQHCVNH